jgi:hypothetical protein
MKFNSIIIKIELSNKDLDRFKKLNLKPNIDKAEVYERQFKLDNLLHEPKNSKKFDELKFTKSIFFDYSRIDGFPMFRVWCNENYIDEVFRRKLIVDFVPEDKYQLTLIKPLEDNLKYYKKINEKILWTI